MKTKQCFLDFIPLSSLSHLHQISRFLVNLHTVTLWHYQSLITGPHTMS